MDVAGGRCAPWLLPQCLSRWGTGIHCGVLSACTGGAASRPRHLPRGRRAGLMMAILGAASIGGGAERILATRLCYSETKPGQTPPRPRPANPCAAAALPPCRGGFFPPRPAYRDGPFRGRDFSPDNDRYSPPPRGRSRSPRGGDDVRKRRRHSASRSRSPPRRSRSFSPPPGPRGRSRSPAGRPSSGGGGFREHGGGRAPGSTPAGPALAGGGELGQLRQSEAEAAARLRKVEGATGMIHASTASLVSAALPRFDSSPAAARCRALSPPHCPLTPFAPPPPRRSPPHAPQASWSGSA